MLSVELKEAALPTSERSRLRSNAVLQCSLKV